MINKYHYRSDKSDKIFFYVTDWRDIYHIDEVSLAFRLPCIQINKTMYNYYLNKTNSLYLKRAYYMQVRWIGEKVEVFCFKNYFN